MKNSKITHKITQGMYILTVPGGGCVVDAVSRVGGSGDQALVAVAVAKTNHSHKLLSENSKFALSVLGENASPELIQIFGFKSSKDIDKCAKCQTEDVAGVPVVKESLGYMVFEKYDTVDNDTHTIFIGKLLEADLFDDQATPMTYAYYQAHKSELAHSSDEPTLSSDGPTPSSDKSAHSSADLAKATTEQGKTAWVCTVCGYVYYGDEVPDDYLCPLCGLGKSYFKRKD